MGHFGLVGGFGEKNFFESNICQAKSGVFLFLVIRRRGGGGIVKMNVAQNVLKHALVLKNFKIQ